MSVPFHPVKPSWELSWEIIQKKKTGNNTPKNVYNSEKPEAT